MRIIFVIWGYEHFGGMERRYVRLAQKLSEITPNEIFVLCRKVSRKSIESILGLKSNVKIIDIKPSTTGIIGDTINLLKAVNQIRPDHTHICTNPSMTSSFFALLSRFLPPFSFSMTDSTFEENIKQIDMIFARISAKYAVSIDCISEGTSRILSKYIDAKDRYKLKNAPCSFTDPSRRIEVTSRDIDVISIARFIEGKGYDLIEKIFNEISHLNIYICGFGPRKPILPGAKIIQTENPFDLLSRSKIFLSLQRVNNYPSQPLLEAMVCECAVIATDVGETRKIVDESRALLISYDAQSLRDAIFNLISNPEKAATIGRNAKDYVIKYHTIERYAEYFLKEVIRFT